jgi:capsular polysaccharide biosynthesis protein
VADWCDDEEPTRLGLIAEVQRIRRRTIARPLPVIALALFVTGVLAYRITTHKAAQEAKVVLVLSQGLMSGHSSGLPVEELKDYVTSVLMPNAKLAQLIERRDLYKLRKKLGMEFAIEELRSQTEVEVWKNTFVSDYESDVHSARIGITVADTDPDKAYNLAHDMATIVIETSAEQRADQTKKLTADIASFRAQLEKRIADIETAMSKNERDVRDARALGHEDRAETLDLGLAQLRTEQESASHSLELIAQSRDANADQIAAAGLDVTIDIVDEIKPRESDHRSFVIAMVIVVIAFGAALGSALIVGAFDARVHDTDDVERLGLTVLGHLPRFPGDEVGSLEARGALRGRVPSSKRWRWLR